MTDDTNKPDGPDGSPSSNNSGFDGTSGASDNLNGDDLHFNDAELEAAMADFEREFNQDTAGDNAGSGSPDSGNSDDTTDSPIADHTSESNVPDASDIDNLDSIEDLDNAANGAQTRESAIETSFDDELQGLLGNKAKAAVIITRLTSAELLAAFCQLSDISAICLDDPQGAVAVLRNLNGDGPEAAAKDLTTVVSGMPAVLVVNRADKLEATMYLLGETRDNFAPPLLFSAAAPFVEDLMLGITPLDDILADNTSYDAAALTREQALAILARHTKFGRGNSSIA
ncbi:hypothetical protein [Bifidobacterium boum]|uniref:hypothetical protein n=1 Tax=Bifidobacterium boum TaxID=78343 RepID=UPI003F9055E5